jgi:protein-tyrosine phosphatase
MLGPTTVEDWKDGRLLSVGDRGRWLLVEMPHRAFLDAVPVAEALRPLGVRLIIAHAERYPELLTDPGLTARWIAAGCLIQVTAKAFAEPWDAGTEKALRVWATGGFVHLLGSDGHGIDRRRPVLYEGFRRLAKWVGPPAAERIAGLWGVSVLQGLPVNVPAPNPPSRSWFTRLFGG